LGYLWAAFDPVRKLPFFFYEKGRGHKGPLALLDDFVGTLQCDGYSAYETLDRKVSGIRLPGCMAHIRRKFFEAKGNDEKWAQQALLYTLLSACKQHGVNPEAWLTDVLNRMYKHPVNRLQELLPQNWKPAEQPEPEKEKAEDA
jgi:hypothetical protein